jgi:hypothetical protein
MYQQGKMHLALSYSYSTRSWEIIDLFIGFPIPDLSFQGYLAVPANRQTIPRLLSLLQGRAKCVKACLRHQLTFSGMLKPHLLPSVHRSLATRSPRHSMGGRTESSLPTWTPNCMHEPALHDLPLAPVVPRVIRKPLPEPRQNTEQIHELPGLVD